MSLEGRFKREPDSTSLRECLDGSHEDLGWRFQIVSSQSHALVRGKLSLTLPGCVGTGEREGDPLRWLDPQVMRRKECYQNSLQTEPRHHNGRWLEQNPTARVRPRCQWILVWAQLRRCLCKREKPWLILKGQKRNRKDKTKTKGMVYSSLSG